MAMECSHANHNVVANHRTADTVSCLINGVDSIVPGCGQWLIKQLSDCKQRLPLVSYRAKREGSLCLAVYVS